MIFPNIWIETEVRKLTKFLQVTQVINTSKFFYFKGFALSNQTIFFFLQVRFQSLFLKSCTTLKKISPVDFSVFIYLVIVDLGPQKLYWEDGLGFKVLLLARRISPELTELLMDQVHYIGSSGTKRSGVIISPNVMVYTYGLYTILSLYYMY